MEILTLKVREREIKKTNIKRYPSENLYGRTKRDETKNYSKVQHEQQHHNRRTT